MKRFARSCATKFDQLEGLHAWKPKDTGQYSAGSAAEYQKTLRVRRQSPRDSVIKFTILHHGNPSISEINIKWQARHGIFCTGKENIHFSIVLPSSCRSALFCFRTPKHGNSDGSTSTARSVKLYSFVRCFCHTASSVKCWPHCQMEAASRPYRTTIIGPIVELVSLEIEKSMQLHNCNYVSQQGKMHSAS